MIVGPERGLRMTDGAAKKGDDGDDALRVTVRFLGPASVKPPLLGEFATRSRIGSFLQLEEEVSFALQAPCWSEASVGSRTDQKKPPTLNVRVSGLSFEPLPGAVDLRTRMKAALGDGFCKASAYTYWQEHRDKLCPLRDSKLRRVIEAMLDLKSASLIPLENKQDTIWGYVHATAQRWESLEFIPPVGKGGVTMAARLRPLVADLEETEAEACGGEVCRKVLLQNRQNGLGEVFAASAFNLLRLYHGQQVGECGASVKKITKLISAARAWGVGKDGWQREDDTWQCVDDKGWLGRGGSEQGRVIWRGTCPAPAKLSGR